MADRYDLIVNAAASATSAEFRLASGAYGLSINGNLGTSGSVQLQAKNMRAGDWHPVGPALTVNDDAAVPAGARAFGAAEGALVRAVVTTGAGAAGIDVSIGRISVGSFAGLPVAGSAGQGSATPRPGLSAATFAQGAAAGSPIGDVTGLLPGETVVGVAPNDGRVAVAANGSSLVVGLSLSRVGSTPYSLTTNLGRGLQVIISTTGNVQPGAPPFASNFNPAYLSRIKAKLAAVMAGTADALILCWGDSLTSAQEGGSGGTANFNDAWVASYPGRLAAGLAGNRNAIYEGRCGTNGVLPSGSTTLPAITAYHSGRDVWSSGATRTTSTSIGGGYASLNTAGDTETYTPATAVGKLDIYIQRQSGGGTITVSRDGTVLQTIDTNGAQTGGFIKTTVTANGSDSTAPWTIACTVTGPTFVSVLDFYRKGGTNTRVLNAGLAGTRATNQAATGAGTAMTGVAAIAPDLTIINIGRNDVTGGTTVSDYTTALTAMVNQAKVSGDVILCWPNGAGNPTADAPYKAAMLQVAQSTNCVMMAWDELMVSLGARNADGTQGPNFATNYGDGIHLKAAGYQAEADSLQALLAA